MDHSPTTQLKKLKKKNWKKSSIQNILAYNILGGVPPQLAPLGNPPILVWNNSPCCLECGL